MNMLQKDTTAALTNKQTKLRRHRSGQWRGSGGGGGGGNTGSGGVPGVAGASVPTGDAVVTRIQVVWKTTPCLPRRTSRRLLAQLVPTLPKSTRTDTGTGADPVALPNAACSDVPMVNYKITANGRSPRIERRSFAAGTRIVDQFTGGLGSDPSLYFNHIKQRHEREGI